MGKIKPYVKTDWVPGLTPVTRENMTNIEEQVESITNVLVEASSTDKSAGAIVVRNSEGKVEGDIAGNSGTTTKFDKKKLLKVTGVVNGQVQFDGSEEGDKIEIATTLDKGYQQLLDQKLECFLNTKHMQGCPTLGLGQYCYVINDIVVDGSRLYEVIDYAGEVKLDNGLWARLVPRKTITGDLSDLMFALTEKILEGLNQLEGVVLAIKTEKNSALTAINSDKVTALNDIALARGTALGTLEQYMHAAENGGNANSIQGYVPRNFKRTEDTIADLVSSASNKYRIGDIVELNGYYTAGDGAGHKRKIEPADDGSGVQLANGLWANIVHNGEVKVSWFGVKKSDNLEIVDCVPFLSKILTVDLPLVFRFDNGFYAFSDFEIKKYGKSFVGVSENPIPQFFDYNKISNTVFIPFYNDQESVLSFGTYENELNRGTVIQNIEICTNLYTIENNKMVRNKRLGAKRALTLKSFSFSKVRDIIINGTNDNIECGIYWNGFETYFEDIMFRGLGNLKYGFNKTAFLMEGKTNPTYAIPSGSILKNFSFEGVFMDFITSKGYAVDITIDGINFENGYFENLDNIESIKYEPDYSIYESLSIFKLSNTKAFNITNITGQSMGVSYLIDGKKYSFNTIVKYGANYGDFTSFSVSNVSMQATKGDIYTYKTGKYEQLVNFNPDRNDFQTFKNITTDAYSFIKKIWEGSNYHDDIINFPTRDNKISNKKNNSLLKHFDVFDNVLLDRSMLGCNYSTSIKNQSNIPPEDLNKIFNREEVFRVVCDLAIKKRSTLQLKTTLRSNGYSDVSVEAFAELSDGTKKKSNKIFLQSFELKKESIYNFDIIIEDSTNVVAFGIQHEYVQHTTDNAGLIIVNDLVVDCKLSPISASFYNLDTPYYTYKMQQEGIYEDFISYMDSQHEYDKEQKALETAKQEAYQLALAENSELVYEEWLASYPELMPVHQEPVPSERLLEFYNEYK